MFLDEVEISVQAGNGGAGAVSFRRERYDPRGGPNGGHGGNGGNVILVADANYNTLHHFVGTKSFRAKNGEGGSGSNKFGKNGEDLILKVPMGTIVLEHGTLVADLTENDKTWLAASGGLGGKGNANFVSSTRQAPRFAELGEPCEKRKLKLELKLLADVGIIGLPSVGKSTLISVVSSARPKIAAYPFTTLVPNLGVVAHHRKNFVVTDLPGLIRGASCGRGLGHQFLRHAERVQFFWHLIDGSSLTPVSDFRTIHQELKKFNPALAKKPTIIVISKADILDEKTIELVTQKLKKACRQTPFVISAATHSGIKELLNYTLESLEKTKPVKAEPPKITIFRPHLEPKSKSFNVRRKNKKLFFIDGPRLNQIVVMSDITNPEALARIQDVLKKFGVNRELARAGAEPGAIVEIAKKRFEWWGQS